MRVQLADGVTAPATVPWKCAGTHRRRPARARRPAPRRRPRTCRRRERWPRPGEDLFLRLANVSPQRSPRQRPPSARWRSSRGGSSGQTVTLVGQFRGRNLFGDLPGGPGKSRLRLRAARRGRRGLGDRTAAARHAASISTSIARVDSDRWVEVTGHGRARARPRDGRGHGIALSKAPAVSDAPTEIDAARPSRCCRSTWCSVRRRTARPRSPPASTIRIQFSRGLDRASLAGQDPASP